MFTCNAIVKPSLLVMYPPKMESTFKLAKKVYFIAKKVTQSVRDPVLACARPRNTKKKNGNEKKKKHRCAKRTLL